MTRRYGKGDLYNIVLVNETTYGILPQSPIYVACGFMSKLKITDNPAYVELASGNRLKGKSFLTGVDPVASVTFQIPKSMDYSEVLLNWLTPDGYIQSNGSVPTRHAYFSVSASVMESCSGVAMNKLTIASTGIGERVNLTADLFLREHALIDPEDVSRDLYERPPASEPLRCKSYWTIDSEEIKSGKWTLSIDQKLQKVADMDDEGNITLASGQRPYFGDAPEITLEITVPVINANATVLGKILHNTDMYDDTKMDRQIYIDLGTKRIRLNGYFEPVAIDRQDVQYETTLRFVARSVACIAIPTS